MRQSLEEALHYAPFPRKLAAAMALRGMSARELSRQVGSISHAAICNILNGRSDPKASTLLKLADALDVEAGTLMEYPKPEPLTVEESEWMNAPMGEE